MNYLVIVLMALFVASFLVGCETNIKQETVSSDSEPIISEPASHEENISENQTLILGDNAGNVFVSW